MAVPVNLCGGRVFVGGVWQSAVGDGFDGPSAPSENWPGGFRRLEQHMQLGAFSLSLAVKDIAASAAFYEKLGFTKSGGDEDQNWLILRNGQTVIGLFQGMFDKNSLTFNPGWNQDAQQLDSFTDVRDLQQQLKERGVPFIAEAGDGTGPASFIVVDPDGNPIIVDQHV